MSFRKNKSFVKNIEPEFARHNLTSGSGHKHATVLSLPERQDWGKAWSQRGALWPQDPPKWEMKKKKWSLWNKMVNFIFFSPAVYLQHVINFKIYLLQILNFLGNKCKNRSHACTAALIYVIGCQNIEPPPGWCKLSVATSRMG